MNQLTDTQGGPLKPCQLPGPRGRFLTTYRIMTSPYHWYEVWTQRHGKTFFAKALNGNVVVTSDCEIVKGILRLPHDAIQPFAIKTTEPFVGRDSVFLAEGEKHKRERSILTPHFHGESIDPSWPTIHGGLTC